MSGRQDASTSTSDSNTTSASASSSGTSARPPSPSGSPPRQRRRVGDGLDMRRPATTQPPREYIDLTQDDSSPPPATRLSAGTTGTNHIRQAIPVQQAPNAPEIVDVDELPDVIDLEALDNESPPHDHIPFHDLRAAHHDRHAVQHQMQLLRRTGFQGFAQDDDADYGVSHFAIPRSQVPHRHVPRERIAQHMMHALGHRILDGIPAARRREVIWDRLPMLDYDAVPFHLNGEAGPSAAPEPPVPTYDAPSAPQEGYSRNPAEDEVAICPNCNEELATGESELKRQMWVVKGCGHVSSLIHAPTTAVRRRKAVNYAILEYTLIQRNVAGLLRRLC